MESLHCDPAFERLLADYDRNSLEKSDNTIYGLWPDLRLAYVNQGWFRFAEENGGLPELSSAWCLGSVILDAVPLMLKDFFKEKFTACLTERRPWEHLYECSTGDLYREFHMTAFPLGRGEGLLIINSLRLERVHSRDPLFPLESLYRNEQGFVTQCCHCRRVLRLGWNMTWDWIPAWVESPPSDVRAELCEPCLSHYWT